MPSERRFKFLEALRGCRFSEGSVAPKFGFHVSISLGLGKKKEGREKRPRRGTGEPSSSVTWGGGGMLGDKSRKREGSQL